ncbi:MAG: tetratricopeptide repeat protein [Legionellales bacterium]|nr:tetratricopeptide repeat protein [Legionellales bacterium]
MMKKLLLISLLFIALNAQAFTWQDLWLRRDQQGIRALRNGDPRQAAQLFQSIPWQGVAEYQAGNFNHASKKFSQQKTSDGYYNQGNSLAQLKDYDGAIAAYDKAIQLNPNNHDAIYNRDLLKKLQQQQQQAANSSSAQQANPHPTHSKNQQHAPSSNLSHSAESHSAAKPTDKTQDPSSLPNPPQELANKTDPNATNKVEQIISQREQQQATQQWLRRIPDEPGSLLKQIFWQEYRKRLEAGGHA